MFFNYTWRPVWTLRSLTGGQVVGGVAVTVLSFGLFAPVLAIGNTVLALFRRGRLVRYGVRQGIGGARLTVFTMPGLSSADQLTR